MSRKNTGARVTPFVITDSGRGRLARVLHDLERRVHQGSLNLGITISHLTRAMKPLDPYLQRAWAFAERCPAHCHSYSRAKAFDRIVGVLIALEKASLARLLLQNDDLFDAEFPPRWTDLYRLTGKKSDRERAMQMLVRYVKDSPSVGHGGALFALWKAGLRFRMDYHEVHDEVRAYINPPGLSLEDRCTLCIEAGRLFSSREFFERARELIGESSHSENRLYLKNLLCRETNDEADLPLEAISDKHLNSQNGPDPDYVGTLARFYAHTRDFSRARETIALIGPHFPVCRAREFMALFSESDDPHDLGSALNALAGYSGYPEEFSQIFETAERLDLEEIRTAAFDRLLACINDPAPGCDAARSCLARVLFGGPGDGKQRALAYAGEIKTPFYASEAWTLIYRQSVEYSG